jgi:Sec-independent protein secretion pathway components
MPQLGPAELLVVLIVALMVFGPKRLPEVGRQVGRGLRELRKIQDTVRAEINDVLHADDTPDTPSPSPSYRSSGTPAPVTGRPAPSRFRPAPSPLAATPALTALPAANDAEPAGWTGATAATETDAPPASPLPSSPSPQAGTHAPSRFRAPGV